MYLLARFLQILEKLTDLFILVRPIDGFTLIGSNRTKTIGVFVCGKWREMFF